MRTREIVVDGKSIAISGRIFNIARLKHEWFEFLEDPAGTIAELEKHRRGCDVFTFLQERSDSRSFSYHKESAHGAVLRVSTYQKWWKAIDYSVRNKIRKAEKSGVELRNECLNDNFIRGVEQIYNESPIRQGRPFRHYGKDFPTIKGNLGTVPDYTFFIGAYHGEELIGFMKLYQGQDILRTVHIIAKLSHRNKPVQDALIAKAVKICEEKSVNFLHYGDWSRGGLGAFKIKHGFERFEFPRYFKSLTTKGSLMLKLKLHHDVREYVPARWTDNLATLRNRWNASRFGTAR